MESHGVERKLTTILCADVAGYSRLMEKDEEGTLHALQTCRIHIDRLVEQHQGRIFGTAGDSVVAEFPSTVEAVRCALEVQDAVQSSARRRPPTGACSSGSVSISATSWSRATTSRATAST